jgi:ABC-type transporter MlaC component
MNNRPLTVTLHIGDKPIEKLTPEQSERMAQRLSETMSRYYTANLEEYRKIQIRSEKQLKFKNLENER